MNARTLLCAFCATLFACATLQAHAGEAAHIDTGDCNVPAYLHEWQVNDESGEVLLSFQVDAKGKVKSIKVVESSGWPDLDLASVRSLKRCVFKNAAAAKDWESVKFTWVLK
jgi:TonB family protein